MKPIFQQTTRGGTFVPNSPTKTKERPTIMKKILALGLMFFLSLGFAFAQETNCTDGIDNDADGLIDCLDGDCPNCNTAISCADPYIYYMPPMLGDKATGSLFGNETFQISTLNRAATVQIKNPFTGAVIQTVTVPVANPAIIGVLPNAGATIALNQIMLTKTVATNINTALSGTGLIFTSDQPLQVTYSSKSVSSNFNQDILQLQGKASLGKSFYAASQTELDDSNNDSDQAHFVSVMATEPGTTSITFNIPINAFTGVRLKLKGVAALTTSITINLTKGQTYMIASEFAGKQGTVTGLLVTSDKNIVVNSGDQHVPTSEGNDSDGGFMQLIPIAALETRYIAIDGGNNDSDGAGPVHDVITIIATENGTTFTVNGISGGTDGDGRAVPTTLNAGQYFSYYLSNTNTGTDNQPYYIQTSRKAYVYQITSKTSSEMGMDILPPISTCIGSKQIDFEKTGNTADAIIILPTAGLSSLKFRNFPYTTFAANIDPDGAGALPAAQANVISTSGYSYVVIKSANVLATNNRVTSAEKFHVGIVSESIGTGNYAFISNYEKAIEILDPNTGAPVSSYLVGEVTPGTPFTHCINIVGCGNTNVIQSAVLSGYGAPGPASTVTFANGCITYTMNPAAPSCARETVTVLVENEFGITSTACLNFENATKPFTITISPVNAVICTVAPGNTTNLVASVNSPTGTPTYAWKDPLGVAFAGTSGGVAPNFTTTLTATMVGTYKLTVTSGTCSKTIDIDVTSRNCLDTDGDGVNDLVDIDDDNDGILDTQEGVADTDGDGIPNSLDLDSDNDGIPDVIEAGGVDADGNGIIDNFTDTDGDGLSQNVEGAGNIGLGLPDFDQDGIPNYLDLDSDNDGIPDIIEVGGVDVNNDGLVDTNNYGSNGYANIYDPADFGNPVISTGVDTNNDGLPNSYPEDNADGSPRPNFLDLDSDGDGITDVIEAGLGTFDTDNNGVVDGASTNGWNNGINALPILTLPNSDSNGLPNYLDIDADNDGIPDNIEGQTTAGYIPPTGLDTDGDGIDNAYDNVDTLGTFGGTTGNGIQPTNTDGTDNPDYTDLDTDNDGRPDAIEGFDTNGNGIIDGAEVVVGTTDTDGDGLLNGYDTVVGIGTIGNVNNGTTPTSYPNVQNAVTPQRDWREGPDHDGDGIADNIDLDDDNDGIADTAEYPTGTPNPFADSDGDGVPNYLDISTCAGGVLVNGVCPTFDKDRDGIINQFDLDSDNDGIPDVTESGGADADGDGIAGTGVPAVNPQGQVLIAGIPVINPNLDSDGDGVPNSQDLDADNDGISDLQETNPTLPDANNDGIVDGTDTDGDGIINVPGLDTNTTLGGTNIPAPRNTDGDGVPNYLDLDSDNDGITDVQETRPTLDANGDGVVDGTDTDGDGVINVPGLDTGAIGGIFPPLANADGDSVPNYLDLDSDNDGISDVQETKPGADTNNDGIVDGTDTDGDGVINNPLVDNNTTFGVPVGTAAPRNTDGDAIPNYLDLDSDNDGITDVQETRPTLDTNNDGVVDGTDTDNDGIINAPGLDANTTFGGAFPNPPNQDGDSVPNYLDLDSDNDGISDVAETKPGADTNNDGIVDGTDTDGDGIINNPLVDNNNVIGVVAGTAAPRNTDGTGRPDYIDLDADGDGISDAVEAGLPNTNGIANGTDVDGDGINSSADTNPTFGGTFTTPTNSDGDGVPNYLDIDSDNDGIVDIVEAQPTTTYIPPTGLDSDNDGIDNAYDTFPGQGGGTTLVNTDGADNPDYTDLDTDNDGRPDAIEGWDTNGNGVIDGTEVVAGVADTDGDGLLNGYDTVSTTGVTNTTNGTTPTFYPNAQSPATPERDWRDLPDRDGDGIADNIDLDDDNDGIADTAEYPTGTPSPTDDSDGDGIPNYLDPSSCLAPGAIVNGVCSIYDKDGDGIINSLDLDSDNDGVPDVVEAGGVDPDGDGILGTGTPTVNALGQVTIAGIPIILPNLDTDGDGIPNSQDLDADGDGIPDVIEVGGVDANNDGRPDGVFVDLDRDGFADAVDGNVNGTLNTTIPLILTGADTNNDGRPDSYPNDNADGAGLPNFLDLDSDNDGIPDVVEAGLANTGNGQASGTLGNDGWSDTVDALPTLGLLNSDGIGQPNYLDLDSDNDGILDATEAGIPNTNGIANGTDADGDGVNASADPSPATYGGTFPAPTNSDSDALPNYLDIDADNDGIPDNIEGQTTTGYIPPTGLDTDGDGIDNAYDTVVGPGGIGITPTNTDGTDNPDYTDLDTDNDGISDAVEGWDTDGNGVANTLPLTTDTDGDGLLDGYDTVAGVATTGNVSNGTTPTSYPNVQNPITPQRDWRDLPDRDGDGVADATDLDDDNDGILDVNEYPIGTPNPLADSDSDGIPNYLDASSCGSALVNGVCPTFDRDGDGIINSFDLDADNDGIPDVVEAGGTDANGDGIVDNLGVVATTGPNAGIPVPTVASPYPTTGIGFDFDGDGIPNFLDLDADGDGIPDVVEVGGVDANNDGLPDGVFVDIDKDGFADAVDGVVTAGTNGTPLIVTGPDTNNNGVPDTYPNDNADGSPRPNFLDLDSDNDGINDATEAGIPNTNGVATGTLGNDGWSDTVDALPTLVLPNTDANGQPNYLDIDADNDGIPDNIEGQTTVDYIPPTGLDADEDGIDNAYDTIAGNGGGLTPTNTDGTDSPDYTDLDTDNDGRPDAIEGWDTNGNGVIDGAEVVVLTTDTDGDGLLDGYDTINGTVVGNGVPSNVNNGLPGVAVLTNYPNIQTGNPLQPDWRDPTIGIGVAKSASIAAQPNGTFNVTFTIIVKNLGGQTLNNVQVVDNLATTFPAPASFGVVSNTIVGATANAGYTGTGANTGLFAATQSLAAGASATITLVVNVTKGLTTATTAFTNVATGSGTGALSGVNVTDTSNNGGAVAIDPNNNGNAGEAGENVPTPIVFPVIGVAKQAGAPVQLANGTINIPFTIVVRNTGTEILNNVQVVENLTTTFGTATFNVLTTPAPAATGAIISPTFTGTGANTNLLAATQTLAVGASATITFTVNITPVSPAVAYTNTAVGSGVGAVSGVNTTDNSNNGGIANIDTDNDGINNEVIGTGLVGDNTPTLINLPVIGVAKSVGTPSLNPDGSFDIPFTVIVRNLGTETLTNVTVTDNLAATFPTPATFTILAAPSSAQLTPNGFFNGTTDVNLVVLTPTQTLAVGASATVTFTVNMFPNNPAALPTFSNTAIGNGTGLLSGGTTTDNSNNGGATAIDPNNNGNPRNPGEDTPTTILIPRIGVAKAAGAPVLQGNGSSNVTFTVVVRNYGNEALSNVQVSDNLLTAFPTPAVPSLVGVVTAVGATPNGTYDGVTAAPASRRQLLATAQTLPVGGTITITFTVNIVTNSSVGPFNNIAVGSATGTTSGNTTTDNSNNGSNPDTDNDGNPSEIVDDVPTPINLSNAIIGVAKQAGTPVQQANGSFNMPFTITVTNSGTEILNGIQVTENLATAFPAPATFTITSAPVATGGFTISPTFTGTGANTNLLNASQNLPIGATFTITFTVNAFRNGITSTFTNQVTGTGTGATSGATATDVSTNGTNPNANGIGGPGDDSVPTPINFPTLGVAKEAGVPAVQANGTYNIPFTITVKNLGTEILNSVQVVENLATTFPTPVTFTIVPATLAGTGITANTGFTGTGANTNLAAATQSLAVGATATITFTVNVNLNGFTGALSNSVTGTGTGATSGGTTTDVSDNGLNPDNGGGTSTGNGNPKDPNENDATPIGFPKIGVAKAAGAPVQQANGTFNIPFTIIVSNLGNEALNNTQVTENLTTTFGTTPFSVLATPAPAATGATISPTFTGTGVNTNLLAATQTLAVGASITITFTVNVTPASPAISYSNSVTASGTGAISSVVSVDNSNNGGDTAIDSDNNGNPNEPVDNTATPINLPIIGIAKAVGLPVVNANGTINIPFTIVVKNLGTEVLNGVQVVDNLNLTFPLPATYTISTAPASATLTPNAGFNGNTDTNLLAATQTLAVGASATITFTVQVTTNGTPAAFSNSAVANGTGALSGGTTTDTSNNGSNTILTTGTPTQVGTVIDPNNNGNPTQVGENTPTPITFPRIGLAKAVGTPVLQGNGSYNVPFSIVVTNFGNEIINNVQVTDNLSASFPAPAVPSVLAGAVSVTGGTPNATYTGVGATATANNLLAPANTLAVGATMTITFTVNVVTNGATSFTNSAVASGVSSTNPTVTTTDTSNSGTNADPDNDGNPNEPTENVPTPISIGTPIIGLAKATGTLVQQTNGSFNVPFVITVKNLGTEILNSVQVVENLALAFPAPATFTLVGAPVATGGLTLATGYTGIGANTNLLGAGNTLAVGATATITIVVNVNPRGATTAFTNTAVGTATGANSNLPTTDNSNNGGATEIDIDGDNEPNEPADNVPTPINLPIIGVAKNLVASTLQANGTYRLDFAVIVKNMGTETLNNVRLIENLNLAFPTPLTFALSGVPVATGAGLAANATFTGTGANTNLLAGTSTLAPGVQGTVTFSVIVTLNNATAFSFTNTVVGNGTGATSGVNTTDNSASGTNVDTDGNGLPNENTPTPISLPKPKAVIGVTKLAGTPVIQPQGGFNVTYTIKVKNIGNIALSNVNVKEDLDVTFGNIDRVAGYEVLSNAVTVLAPNVMVANTAFNGKGSATTGGDTNLLTATGNTLAVGAEATITLTVYVRGFGEFRNQVIAQGTGFNGTIAVDTSGNNTNVDEDKDGIADEPAENQPTVINVNPIPVATDIFIPGGFSPNSDGRNDTFVIDGLNGRGADVKIYNRWGNLVFENGDYKNDWAGTANVGLQVGTELPDATYFYIVKLTDGQSFAKYVIIKR